VFTYSAICDVPEETLLHVTALLSAHRREIGTRAGRRAGTVRTQAKLVLRWIRDDAPIRLLAAEAALPISTCYRYLHEAIDVIAEQGPDLHEVLEQARRQGWSHLTLDGTLIEIDRVNERNEDGAITCGTRARTRPRAATCRSSPTRAGSRCGPARSDRAAHTTSPPPARTAWARCTKRPAKGYRH